MTRQLRITFSFWLIPSVLAIEPTHAKALEFKPLLIARIQQLAESESEDSEDSQSE